MNSSPQILIAGSKGRRKKEFSSLS